MGIGGSMTIKAMGLYPACPPTTGWCGTGRGSLEGGGQNRVYLTSASGVAGDRGSWSASTRNCNRIASLGVRP